MATYLQLLQNAQQGGWNMVQSINNALESRIRLEENRRQFNQTMQVRATEFERNMNLREAQFDEEKRMNMAQAQNMRFGNELRWREFQLNEQLAPLKFQAENLRLQSAALNQAQSVAQFNQTQFNQFTNQFDQSASSYLAQIQDPKFGQEYLSIKQAAYADMASGRPFNPNRYQSQVNDLYSRYGVAGDPNSPGYGSARSETSEYSPQITNLLTSLNASPEIINNYERFNNPQKRLTESGLRSSGLYSDGSDFLTIQQGLSRSLSEQELIQYTENVIGFKGAQKELDLLRKERAGLASQVRNAAGTPFQADLKAELTAMDARIASTSSTAEQLRKQALGIPNPIAPENTIVDPIDVTRSGINDQVNDPQLIAYGVPNLDPTSFGATLQKKQASTLPKVLDGFREETMGGNAWGYLAGKNVKKRPQDISTIQSSVLREVKKLSSEGRLKERIRELANNPDKISMVDSLRGQKSYDSSAIQPSFSPYSYVSRYPAGSNPTVEDMLNYLQSIPDDDPLKAKHEEMIYARIISNAMITALSE